MCRVGAPASSRSLFYFWESRGPIAGQLPYQAGGASAPHIHKPYNICMPIPPEIRGQKYISLATFRKNGSPVQTPVWFGEKDEKLYIVTRNDSGKLKRIRNNPQARVAPCTIRGAITGPEFPALARILPPEDWPMARKTVGEKYWLSRLNIFSRHKNVYLEIEVEA